MKIMCAECHQETEVEVTMVTSSDKIGPHIEATNEQGTHYLILDKEEIYGMLIWAQQVLKRNV